MTVFFTGFFLGALASFATLYFTVLRRERDAEQEWTETYNHVARELEALHQQKSSSAPRALTKLTNRERTIEI